VIEVDQEYEERVFTRVKRAMFKRGPNDAVKSNSSLRAMLKKDELKRENGDVVARYPLINIESFEDLKSHHSLRCSDAPSRDSEQRLALVERSPR
jgi:hypothetical protein